MNKDIFCLDIPNHLCNPEISGNPEIFNDNNDDFSNNNQKNFQHQKLNLFSTDSRLDESFNIKNESITDSDKDEYEEEKEREKALKLNIDIHNNNNNINNNLFYNINNNIDNNFIVNNNNVCNCSCNCLKCSQNILFNDQLFKMPYEDYFLNASLNYENSLSNLNENGKNINLLNKNNQNFLFNNNNKNETNNNIFFNINLDFDNKDINNKDIDGLNNKEEKDNNHIICKENNCNNSMIINNKININLSAKRIIKKRKKENKINQVILYGHPQKITYKTMKQKLNIHKKLDLECRNDTILLIYGVAKLKKIVKKILLKKNIRDKIYFQRIQNLYKNSIQSLQHREYAQDITGYKLI